MTVEVFEGHDPRENLARELARFESGADHTLLWRNAPSVILGRNQTAAAEVSACALREIPVLFRSTGGGAVYHDLNNVNFSFIRQESMPREPAAYLAPILAFLRHLGLPVVFSGRNDILLHGSKISGCAMRCDNGATLLHGTLLFRRDAEKMALYLTPCRAKLQRHGVASAAARTGELAPFLPQFGDVCAFTDALRFFLETIDEPAL